MQYSCIRLFEQPLLPRQIHPCSLSDVSQLLARIPETDLEGLKAIGLVTCTRKDSTAYGRYFGLTDAAIHLMSYPESFCHKLPPHWSIGQAQNAMSVEMEYGMRLVSVGARLHCEWTPENLRSYYLEHILLHEIGHHVHYRQRKRNGEKIPPPHGSTEQFAEAYAIRMARELTTASTRP